MKNINLIPTDKPSRLGYLTKKGKEVYKDLRLFDRLMPNILDSENQHIYITSNEEIKQVCENCKVEISKWGCGCAKPKEEPKQETLEEAAKRIYGTDESKDVEYYAFINGAKWQAERRYSEDEVRIMFSESFKASLEGYNITSDEIIEQFKNKER